MRAATLEGEVGGAEVGIGPRLRHPSPRVGPAEEGAYDRFLPELPAPPLLGAKQLGDHGLVLIDVGMLGVEAHLEGKHGGGAVAVGAEHLGLVVLAGGSFAA